ncbi:MAG: hypothetical protein KIT56_00300 [Gammaproteobacteria bacterium]|nr:hypothetical protein [Gammaproteobacteria bacterium]MCW5582326.1 hypothetical protein [Gammaproteobacteria bacterium]
MEPTMYPRTRTRKPDDDPEKDSLKYSQAKDLQDTRDNIPEQSLPIDIPKKKELLPYVTSCGVMYVRNDAEEEARVSAIDRIFRKYTGGVLPKNNFERQRKDKSYFFKCNPSKEEEADIDKDNNDDNKLQPL